MPNVIKTTSSQADTAALSVNLGGPAQGQWLQMTALAVNGGTARTFTTPTGWTLEETSNNGDFAGSVALFTKEAGSNESDPVTLNLSGSGTVIAIVDIIDDSGGPRIADASLVSSSGTTIDSPSIAALSGDLVVEQAAAAGFDGSDFGWTIPTDNEEVQAIQGGSNSGPTAGAQSVYFVATGTTTAATWTSTSTDQHKVASSVAWAPFGEPVKNARATIRRA